MALKAIIFLLASLLLVTARVSSNDEESLMEAAHAPAPVKAPARAPVKAPARAPARAPTPERILPPVKVTECPKLCGKRCRLHLRVKLCKRVCTTCCKRCKCVPPGTHGNQEKCGKCYTDMTTHGSKLKCP